MRWKAASLDPLDRGSLPHNHKSSWNITSDGAASRFGIANWNGMHLRPLYAGLTRSSYLLAFVLALLLGGDAVSAAPLASPTFDAEAHARVCKCGPHCRAASCCCGRSSSSREETPASTPIPSDRESPEDSGPCLGESPCGDPGLPSSTPPGPTSRSATLPLSPPCRPLSLGDLLPTPASCHLLSGRPARIDRPPRS